ncbi:hypothetical protein UFOVP41_47 [uncultured Caudovirales phage]|uniref:Uncharacterized protein n=1 Tax=uncultured Caudovirales phage TaxID=2100421 RepID=A0A6J5KRA2_9CAUD|nr:hypothetical protein UFOVP41_47 [uncultured Caudovirales phage]
MAGFTADLNPKNNAMSLGDLMKMGLYSAETEIANRKAQIAEQEQREMPFIQNFMKDPDNKLPDGSFDLKQMPALISIAPITGPQYADKIINLTKNHIETNRALNSLSEENRKPFASIYGNYGQIAANGQPVTPGEVIESLNRLKEFYPQLAQAADGQIKGWQARPLDKPVDPQSLLKARNESLSPTQLIDQFAPKATTGTVGGQTVGMVTQPSVMGERPTISTSPLGGGQSMVSPGGAEGSVKPMPKLIQEDTTLSYSGSANPLNLNKYQEEAYAGGKKNVTEANMAVKSVKDLQQAVRKVEDYMGSASGSKAYQMVQSGGKWVFGNADLDALVKNIAQVQARNATVMGLDKTDSSRDLNAKLSGSEKIDPQALAGVMQQVKAEATAAELYTQGVNKFVEKRGDVNGYIQQQKFQNKWAEHYDPRIFQVDDIAQSKLPEPEKEAKIKDITSRMSKSEFDKYKEDRQVIHRLAKGLYQ